MQSAANHSNLNSSVHYYNLSLSLDTNSIVPDRPRVQLVVYAQRRDSCLLELHSVVCCQAVYVCRPHSTSQESIGKSSGFESQLMIGTSAIAPEGVIIAVQHDTVKSLFHTATVSSAKVASTQNLTGAAHIRGLLLAAVDPASQRAAALLQLDSVVVTAAHNYTAVAKHRHDMICLLIHTLICYRINVRHAQGEQREAYHAADCND
eukprot:20048-Heterococcus_DN1.PRE.1